MSPDPLLDALRKAKQPPPEDGGFRRVRERLTYSWDFGSLCPFPAGSTLSRIWEQHQPDLGTFAWYEGYSWGNVE